SHINKKNELILFIEPLATASEKPKGFSIVPQISSKLIFFLPKNVLPIVILLPSIKNLSY
ncbi:hypothetical protein, partial [Bacteroides xylanisolvens]|uniref:hypothetical protein n=1 Tax=Bacteroides xylanisolvens TaxID=371601 RepID=UPI001E5D29B9